MRNFLVILVLLLGSSAMAQSVSSDTSYYEENGSLVRKIVGTVENVSMSTLLDTSKMKQFIHDYRKTVTMEKLASISKELWGVMDQEDFRKLLDGKEIRIPSMRKARFSPFFMMAHKDVIKLVGKKVKVEKSVISFGAIFLNQLFIFIYLATLSAIFKELIICYKLKENLGHFSGYLAYSIILFLLLIILWNSSFQEIRSLWVFPNLINLSFLALLFCLGRKEYVKEKEKKDSERKRRN